MQHIPQGYTTITPYICFDDTAKAIDFYKKALNAKEIMRIPAPDGQVKHAELQIGNARLMMGNVDPKWGGQSAHTLKGSPISFYLYLENVEAAFRQAKQMGMSVKMELEDTFWGDRMGTLNDPFHIQWTLAQHVRDVPEDEMQEAAKKYAAS